MTTTDSGVAFWLNYVSASGGAWEQTGGTVLSLLPSELQQRHGQPEELAVTADPDAAREESATLLTAGHPLLAGAAEFVLATGDCEVLRLAPLPAKPPTPEQLLDHARGQFGTDHGRIDLTGGPRPAARQILRVGALVTYTLSTDDQFQEQLECWMDVGAQLPLSAPVAAGLRNRLAELHPGRDQNSVDLSDLIPALSAAHQRLEDAAVARERELSPQVVERYHAERSRATGYYDDAENSLQRRLASATPDRMGSLSARLESTAVERARRLAEIDEKYRAQHSLLPFRLHVVAVPVLRLEVDIRRGDRRYPAILDWHPAARSFFAERCPHCRSTAILVAGKDRLGCRDCLHKTEAPTGSQVLRAVPNSTAQPPVAAPKPGPESRAAAAPPPTPTPTLPTPPRPPTPRVVTAPRPSRPPIVKPEPGLSWPKLNSLGSKLVLSLWQFTSDRDRRVQRLLLPDTPAATAFQLFGPDAARIVLGIDPASRLEDVRSAPGRLVSDAEPYLINGEVSGSKQQHPFQLAWVIRSGQPKISELTPFAHCHWPRMPDLSWQFRLDGAVSEPGGFISSPRIELDQVAAIIYQRWTALFGLPLILRALTAWRRIADEAAPLHSEWKPAELAASIVRSVLYRAGLPAGYEEVASLMKVDVLRLRAVSETVRRRLKLTASTVW